MKFYYCTTKYINFWIYSTWSNQVIILCLALVAALLGLAFGIIIIAISLVARRVWKRKKVPTEHPYRKHSTPTPTTERRSLKTSKIFRKSSKSHIRNEIPEFVIPGMMYAKNFYEYSHHALTPQLIGSLVSSVNSIYTGTSELHIYRVYKKGPNYKIASRMDICKITDTSSNQKLI